MTGNRRRFLFGLAILTATGGCQRKQRTELVVEIGSNLVASSELDKVDLALTANGKTQHTPYSLVSNYQLPLHVGVVEAADGAGSMEIVATGYLHGSPIVSESAVLGFVETRSMLLKLFLAAECRGDPCTDPGLTCTTGGVCRTKVRTPSELAPFDPGSAGGTGGGRADGGGSTGGSGGTGAGGLGGAQGGAGGIPMGGAGGIPMGGAGGAPMGGSGSKATTIAPGGIPTGGSRVDAAAPDAVPYPPDVPIGGTGGVDAGLRDAVRSPPDVRVGETGSGGASGGRFASGGMVGGTTATAPRVDAGVLSCADPLFPVYCGALGTVPASCWSPGTACSTITSCGGGGGGLMKACSDASKKVFCGSQECCTPPAAGGTCSVFPPCGCASGQACNPSTQATGLKCFPSSGLGEGADCTGATAVCASGLGCFGGYCREYCQLASDCVAVDSARECSPTSWSAGGTTIPGVSVCARVCDPVSPQNPRSPLLSCPAGFGCTPVTSFPGASSCQQQAGTWGAGAACATDNDCAPGNYCAGTTCAKYCSSSANCRGTSTCQFFTPPFYAGTTQVGVCSGGTGGSGGITGSGGTGSGGTSGYGGTLLSGGVTGAGGIGGGGGTSAGGTSGTSSLSARLSAVPISVTFGSVSVNGSSAEVGVTITNVGGAATGALSLAKTGADAAMFVVRSTTCWFGQPLGSAQSCALMLHFSPTGTAGSRSAMITVGDGTNTVSVAIVGTAIASTPSLPEHLAIINAPPDPGDVSLDVAGATPPTYDAVTMTCK